MAECGEISGVDKITTMDINGGRLPEDYSDGENERLRVVIKVDELAQYLENTPIGGIVDQYKSLKFGPAKSWEIGKKPENRMKNRYTDLLPYDETRVVLKRQKKEKEEPSDYINANYIDGYKKPHAYISTQGPLEHTIADFWYMIWQEGTCKIVMAANIIEDGKKKCEKYWPDTTATYGDITVSLQSEDWHIDYTIRNFLLRHKDDTSNRTLRQYHFTAWPDHGVPVYPLSLALLLKSVKKYQPFCTAPVVLHCSAGVGRSGTVMLLDASIDMAESERRVDLMGTLARMRQQRPNLVETIEQYVFVYRALSDMYCGDVPYVSCDDFHSYYSQLTQAESPSRIKQQYEKLNSLTWPLESALPLLNTRAQFKVADGLRGEVFYNININKSQELHHLYVNGYGKRNSYLVTKCPQSESIHKFWQLVYDAESAVIVVLGESDIQVGNNQSFWPESGTLHQGNLRIDYKTSELSSGVMVHTFSLNNSLEPSISRSIKQCHLLDWKGNELTPSSANSVIGLLNKSEMLSKGKPIVVVYKHNLSTAGMFCAAAVIHKQVIEDRMVDVFSAVRTVRQANESFVDILENYEWLYELASAIIGEHTSRL